MFDVNISMQLIEVKNGEDMPSHLVPKWAVADIRTAVKFGSGNSFSDHVVVIEKSNGKCVEIPMGQVQEKAAWTNDVTGMNLCVADLVAWMNA